MVPQSCQCLRVYANSEMPAETTTTTLRDGRMVFSLQSFVSGGVSVIEEDSVVRSRRPPTRLWVVFRLPLSPVTGRWVSYLSAD